MQSGPQNISADSDSGSEDKRPDLANILFANFAFGACPFLSMFVARLAQGHMCYLPLCCALECYDGVSFTSLMFLISMSQSLHWTCGLIGCCFLPFLCNMVNGFVMRHCFGGLAIVNPANDKRRAAISEIEPTREMRCSGSSASSFCQNYWMMDYGESRLKALP